VVVAATAAFLPVRRALNALHARLAREGFTQIFLDQATENIITVTRFAPVSGRSVLLVARTALSSAAVFSGDDHPPPIQTLGRVIKVLLHATPVAVTSPAKPEPQVAPPAPSNPHHHNHHHAGHNSASYHAGETRGFVTGDESMGFACVTDVAFPSVEATGLGLSVSASLPHVLSVSHLAPGAILVVEMMDTAPAAFELLAAALDWPLPLTDRLARMGGGAISDELLGFKHSGSLPPPATVSEDGVDHRATNREGIALREALAAAISALTLLDLNFVLFRSALEEHGHGAPYDVPGFGALPYCGLQGAVTVLRGVSERNDLAHPLCANLRAGDWLLDYHVARLASTAASVPLATALFGLFSAVRGLPRSVVPSATAHVLASVHALLVQHAVARMAPRTLLLSTLGRGLALTSVQLYGYDGPPPSRLDDTDPSAATSGLLGLEVVHVHVHAGLTVSFFTS
jgi:glycogen debranching enzyme